MSEYLVKNIKKNIYVEVPGSKSITNRALLIATLSKGITTLKGALNSEDSMHFLASLKRLGFKIEDYGDQIRIHGTAGIIPNKRAEIYVGSAGTAARFLTTVLALSDGEYTIKASEQMAKRPMKELMIALEELGASFTFLEQEHALPCKVKGKYNGKKEVAINIDVSSQYLSALLMVVPMLQTQMTIYLTGRRKAKSYVSITMRMMEQFGVHVKQVDTDTYFIDASRESYIGREYLCEPDVSAACYYYAMAAITGKEAIVKGVTRLSMQGDIRFLSVLERMGCRIEDKEDGVCVTGPRQLHGIEVDLSDCSDQTMTLAAISPYADTPVRIYNIAHIRNQESDRIHAIAMELNRVGIVCEEGPDELIVRPGIPKAARIETYEDHRMAMAFAVLGIRTAGISIKNPECCQKTFPRYFEILEQLS